jgi:hypothetical protein
VYQEEDEYGTYAQTQLLGMSGIGKVSRAESFLSPTSPAYKTIHNVALKRFERVLEPTLYSVEHRILYSDTSSDSKTWLDSWE